MSKNISKAVKEYSSRIKKSFKETMPSKKPNPEFFLDAIPARFDFPLTTDQIKQIEQLGEAKKWRVSTEEDVVSLELLGENGKSQVSRVETPVRHVYRAQTENISSTISLHATQSQDQLAMTSASTNSLKQSLMGRKIENVSWQDFSFHRFAKPPKIQKAASNGGMIPPSAPPSQPKATAGPIGTESGFEGRRASLSTAILNDPNITVLSSADRTAATEILNGIEAALFSKRRVGEVTPDAIVSDVAYASYCVWMMDGLIASLVLDDLVIAALKVPTAMRNDFYDLLYVPDFPRHQAQQVGLGNRINLRALFEATYDENNGDWSTYVTALPDLISDAWIAKLPQYRTAADGVIKATKDAETAAKNQTKEPPPMPDKTYNFRTFEPGSWNLGLRVIHRQEWRPIGIQRGEIVKTIPLGPKQVEKVSSKVIKKSKMTQTSETIRATESSTESTDTTKDSSDVVQEASKSFGWHIEAEASANAGWAEASIKGGAEGKESESSKASNNHLSESMQKTANKMRSESKVVVSMETETTFENERSSEIQNPNDDIAVTYVYSKMQRQYEIFTSLAEVHSVIFVAEDLPPPNKINPEWVRKHDWMISKVLLDESFRDTLNFICTDDVADPSLASKTGELNDQLKGIFGSAKTSMEKISTTSNHISLSSVDVLQEAQKAYRENFKEQRELQRIVAMWNKKIERFLEHLRKNILHYMRTIWSHEDSDQRMLRYAAQGTLVPTVWKFKPTTGSPQPLTSPVNLSSFAVDGTFEPDTSDSTTLRPLQELINPAGPIGYVGNYAVFYINAADLVRDTRSRVFEMLSILKYPFTNYPEKVMPPNGTSTADVYPDPSGDVAALVDPAMRQIVRENIIPTTFSPKLMRDIIDYLPTLRNSYSDLTDTELAKVADGSSTIHDQIVFADYYHTYLFRKAYTRRLLMDTNNLMIDILKGEDSVLEHFKQQHREVDVDKARAELAKMNLENQRRTKLLALNRLADPDIDKVVAYTDPNSSNYIVVDDFDNDEDEDDEDDDGPQP